MRKYSVAFAATFLASIAQGGAPNMQTQQITLGPTPMFAGDTITIKAGPNMALRVLLDGQTYDVTTGDSGKVEFVLPASGAIFVSDPAGVWQTATDVVQP